MEKRSVFVSSAALAAVLVALVMRATTLHSVNAAPLIYRATASVNDLDTVEGLAPPGQYVELWVEVVREVYPELTEPTARSAVHSVFGLLNSTPHLGRPGSLPGRGTTAELLHRMARGAFAAAGE